MPERTVGIARDLDDEDQERGLPEAAAPTAAESDERPLSNDSLARATRGNRLAETAMWNQYELLISHGNTLRGIGDTISESQDDQRQRLDSLEQNLHEVRDGIQTLIGLLTKND